MKITRRQLNDMINEIVSKTYLLNEGQTPLGSKIQSIEDRIQELEDFLEKHHGYPPKGARAPEKA